MKAIADFKRLLQDVGMLGTVGSHDSGSSGSGDLTAHQEKTEAEIRAEKTKLKNKRAQSALFYCKSVVLRNE